MTEKISTPHSVLTLAWRIWSAGPGPILIDDAAMRAELETALRDGVVLEDEKGFSFASERLMVQSAAQYMLQTEYSRLTSTPKACFERLDEIIGKEIGKEDMVSGHVLALLHNGGHVDAYSWGQQAIEAGVRVFDVLHIMEGAVARFEYARPETIYGFFAGHYDQVKNDLAGGLLYAKLPAWFAKHPDVARELKHLHEANPQERGASLFGCALHGLILHDFGDGFAVTLAAARVSDSMVAGPALHTLGLAEYTEPAHREALEHVIEDCTRIMRSAGHPLLSAAVGTLGRLVTLDEQHIVELLSEAGRSETPEALYQLSEMLFRGQKALGNRQWFWPLLLHLSAAKAEHGGILRNVDMILMGWVRDPARESRVLEFLNAWIAKQPSQTLNEVDLERHFSSTFHRLAEHPSQLSMALTAWLLDDDGRYPLIAQKAVSRLRVKGATLLALDPAQLDELKPNEIRFLLRRILGYIIGDEVQIRLVFSLVRTRNAKERTFEWVITVLRDQVGYDYPHQTIEFLKERQSAQDESTDVKALCGQIVAELQGRLDALNALPYLKEFRPSSLKIRRFQKERQRQMNKAFDEASKGSIWRQIATHIPLKAGRRTFQTVQGRYTDPTELKGISHSIALPRSEITDPAGAARERLLLRNAKKDSP